MEQERQGQRVPQEQPGVQSEMRSQPESGPKTPAAGRLRDKVAIVTGGDSGIGRAVAVAFAHEGADVVVAYLEEHADAAETGRLVREHGRYCLTIAGDLGDEGHCAEVVARTIDELGRLDVLVNNAAEQHVQPRIEDITREQLEATFRSNILAMFFLTRAALPHMEPGSSIINTTSVTAYKGSPGLLDYSSTKGAIVSFTRSLALQVVERGVRVNAVAPGPIWTPLIVSTFEKEKIESFGKDVPMKRPGQPEEVAPAYVFLAAEDSSYITGQVLHPNGGTIVNG
jgi:NAD(P)-dependent dehydrogenase (short-subunit alcohol dehydrogenase family)